MAGNNKETKQFTSDEDLSIKQLDFGLWYLKNKERLRLTLIIFLSVLAAISWSYTMYGFAYYIIRGMKEDELLARQLAQVDVNSNYIKQIAAENLIYYPVQVLPADHQGYDFLSQIENPNDKWWATFDYYFLANGQKTEISSGYIFPKEKKYLAVLSQPVNSYSQAALVVENLRWYRVNQHKISNWHDYYQSHINLPVSGIKFTPAGQSESAIQNRLSFTASNNTAYNYWQVSYLIVAKRSGNIVGVNKYSLPRLASGENRSVVISWPGNLSGVNQTEIFPEVNFMDEGAYFNFVEDQGGGDSSQ